METTQAPASAKGPEETRTFPVITEHIVSTRDTCGGAPRIAGSRIRVKDVVIWHLHQGMSLDEILTGWPHLTLAGLHSALAYYYDHKAQVDAELEADEAWYEEMRASQPSPLREK
jgi:uncharacterized protein (DUF433 family)